MSGSRLYPLKRERAYRFRAGACVPRLIRCVALTTALVLAIEASPALADGSPTDASLSAAWSPIPGNLDEALQRLVAILPAQQTEWIRAGKSSPPEWNRTVGAEVTKNWVDPPGSSLTRYFRGLGIDHPQDISGILGHFYYLYLNHRLRPIDVQAEIRYRERYWARLLTPEKVAAAEALSDTALKNPGLLQSAYARDAQLVGNDFDGSMLSASSIPLIVQERALRDSWILQRISTRSSRGADVYHDILAALDPNLRIVTLTLGAETTLVSTAEGAIGQVLIAAGGPGRPPEFWRMDMHVPETGPYSQQLRCWQAAAGIHPCVALHIGSVTSDAQGRSRFYIEAEYAQPFGATRGHQLSVWLWDGHVATPLYVTSYNIYSDADNQGVTAEGNVLRIGAKGSYRTLWDCCGGRQLVRRIKLNESDRVEELGTTSLTPEMDLIDTLYTRVKSRQPAGDLASPAAMSVIEGSWDAPDRRGPLLLVNEAEEVTGEPGHRQLCFLAEYGPRSLMPPILFTFSQSAPQLRVVSAHEYVGANDRSCATSKH